MMMVIHATLFLCVWACVCGWACVNRAMSVFLDSVWDLPNRATKKNRGPLLPIFSSYNRVGDIQLYLCHFKIDHCSFYSIDSINAPMQLIQCTPCTTSDVYLLLHSDIRHWYWDTDSIRIQSVHLSSCPLLITHTMPYHSLDPFLPLWDIALSPSLVDAQDHLWAVFGSNPDSCLWFVHRPWFLSLTLRLFPIFCCLLPPFLC